MKIKVAINGFGRMGRLAFREAFDRDDLELVHINELHGDAQTAAHLLEFDSVHGRWDRDISVENDTIKIGSKTITVSHVDKPEKFDCAGQGIDLVIECTGMFKTVESLKPYLENGVKKVVVSAPVKDESVLNIVYGVNDGLYENSYD
ncbi:MAG: type I glyceraldehyde-3-phosphate dehydrogenase, partial [Lentisphaeraceae bacterium]|nr:type I glyceraldehyde-3-phosphate dehydrogenase [Lentisphaeraceae bacterium]